MKWKKKKQRMVVKKRRVKRSKLLRYFFISTKKKSHYSLPSVCVCRSKTSSKRTGKLKRCVDESNDNDDDENEDNIEDDNNEGAAAMMAKIMKSPELKKKSALKSGTAVVAKITEFLPLPNGAFVSVVHLSNKPIWYANLEFQEIYLQETWDYKHPEKKGRFPGWVTSWKSHPLRLEHDLSNQTVMKKNSTYAEERWCLLVTTPTPSKEAVMKQLAVMDSYINQIFTTDVIGKAFLEYCYNTNATSIFTGLDKYVAANDEARKNVMTADFNKYGNLHRQYEFGYTLDNFWTDGTIKEFVKKWYKVYSFEELPKEVLEKCYRNYPARRLPVWHDVVDQMLSGR